MVSDPALDLKFIDILASAIIDDVLQIPTSMIEKGFEKLRSTVVDQFLCPVPPMRVSTGVVQRL
ncbi:hypothetical protein LINPERPRIM_LOCUS35106, partial [Linum perenne]